jgi:hypothetical protein
MVSRAALARQSQERRPRQLWPARSMGFPIVMQLAFSVPGNAANYWRRSSGIGFL